MKSRLLPALACAALVISGTIAEAAVLCAKQKKDGTFSTTVKIREICKPSETQLAPENVGFCCGSSTTTTTAVCPTTTTLGIPSCVGSPSSICTNLPCPGGQLCGDDGSGGCRCTGPLHCGGNDNFCGGNCTSGSCQQLPVPAGCPSIGCGCQ